jgi:hypothetical protein
MNTSPDKDSAWRPSREKVKAFARVLIPKGISRRLFMALFGLSNNQTASVSNIVNLRFAHFTPADAKDVPTILVDAGIPLTVIRRAMAGAGNTDTKPAVKEHPPHVPPPDVETSDNVVQAEEEERITRVVVTPLPTIEICRVPEPVRPSPRHVDDDDIIEEVSEIRTGIGLAPGQRLIDTLPRAVQQDIRRRAHTFLQWRATQ